MEGRRGAKAPDPGKDGGGGGMGTTKEEEAEEVEGRRGAKALDPVKDAKIEEAEEVLDTEDGVGGPTTAV